MAMYNLSLTALTNIECWVNFVGLNDCVSLQMIELITLQRELSTGFPSTDADYDTQRQEGTGEF